MNSRRGGAGRQSYRRVVDLIDILGWCVFALGAMMALMGLFWIRQQIRGGDSVTYGTINSNFAFLVAFVVIWISGYSPFHLLWLFPASFVLGFLTLMPGLSAILIPLAKFYGVVATIGLNQEEVEANKARVERIRELIIGGMDKEEAIKLVMSDEQQTK